MKDSVRRLHLRELDPTDARDREVWKVSEDGTAVWQSLDPHDAGPREASWLEKSKVEEHHKARLAAVSDEGRPSRWEHVVSVIACCIAAACMALLPILLQVVMGGWQVPAVGWWALLGAVIAVAGLVAWAGVRGRWRFVGGVFVAVLVCGSVMSMGMFFAQMLGM